MSDDAPRPPVRRRRSAVWALLLLVVLAVTMAGIFPLKQILAQERAVEVTREKLAALEAENTRLEQLATELQTPAEIERMARGRFGLVRPGEIGVVIEWDPEAAPEPVELPMLEHDDRRWYVRVWDWVTGRDYQPPE